MGHGRVFINGGLAYDLATGSLLKGLGAGRSLRPARRSGEAPARHWRTGN
ncbi:MAG: hypothetical protein CM1200mP2_49630 [Planctomycetaceae bacterium]|nr:MAG: hypothetical protein CM1200mP2_49630 [Planctomycetaceae bacterium]